VNKTLKFTKVSKKMTFSI